MKKLSWLQKGFIVCALALGVTIYLAPQKRTSTKVSGTKAIELSDNDAKVEAAVSIVQKGVNPMEGIAMLLEVLQQEPEHAEALMALGLFSMKTGQYEKAIQRFEKLIETSPKMAEAYLRLGECYEITRKYDNAIEHYNRYISLINDSSEITQVNSRIEKLMNNKTL